MKAQDFKDKTPKLVLEEYFAQDLEGRGGFFNRSGRLKTRMNVRTSGKWEGDKFAINETLRYESGEIHKRTFLIIKIDQNHYEVDCDEFVGKGKIESYGNALRWTYYLKEQSKQAGGITLYFDDWMFLSEDGTLFDRAKVSKFGLSVGDVFLSINPVKD